MQKRLILKKFSWADGVILLLFFLFLYGIISFSRLWVIDYKLAVPIHLSFTRLPYYTILSGMRGMLAYLISLFFAISVGYIMAKNVLLEKILLPIFDILQSIPVFGFLPGLFVVFVTLFPHSSFGLECVAIIAIFTGQVWNMIFSFYGSLKTIPKDLEEAATLLNLSSVEKLFQVELPFSAIGLAWNSILSVAGGWFFLIPCESFSLGEQSYRLPGLGSYMDIALKQKEYFHVIAALIMMVGLILFLEVVVWRPILYWVQKFRLEGMAAKAQEDYPLMLFWLRSSLLVKKLSYVYATYLLKPFFYFLKNFLGFLQKNSLRRIKVSSIDTWMRRILAGILGVVFLVLFWKAVLFFSSLSKQLWLKLFMAALLSVSRVFFILTVMSVLMVPIGIWIGTHPQRLSRFSPVIQLCASFPASMLYPLLGLVFSRLHFPLEISCLILIGIAVQWYILFNILSGSIQIADRLKEVVLLLNLSRWQAWWQLYIPSILPSLVTAWIAASGAAWNALVIAEFFETQQGVVSVPGLGASLKVAIDQNDRPVIVASLFLMVCCIVMCNRFIWAKLYQIIQTRYQMEF